MATQMYDTENVEFKFSRLRRHLKVIHFSTLMSSQSSTWRMTTQLANKTGHNLKTNSRFQFCKKYLMVHNRRNQAVYKN